MRVVAADISGGIADSVFLHWAELLQPERRQLVLAMKNRLAAEQTLAGEVLARTLLAQELKKAPSLIKISRTAAGKPFVDGSNGVFFSISHSKALAVACVSGFPCGIDVQHRAEYNSAVMNREFAQADKNFALSAPDVNAAFTLLWTRKESLLKALGTGFAGEGAEKLKEIPLSKPNDCFGFAEFSHGEYSITVCEISAEIP